MGVENEYDSIEDLEHKAKVAGKALTGDTDAIEELAGDAWEGIEELADDAWEGIVQLFSGPPPKVNRSLQRTFNYADAAMGLPTRYPSEPTKKSKYHKHVAPADPTHLRGFVEQLSGVLAIYYAIASQHLGDKSKYDPSVRKSVNRWGKAAAKEIAAALKAMGRKADYKQINSNLKGAAEKLGPLP